VQSVLRYSERCKVCCSRFRGEIDNAIMMHHSPQMIIDSLPDLVGENALTAAMIRGHVAWNHSSAHVSLAFTAAQQMAERNNVVADTVVARLVDSLSLTEQIVAQTFEGIVAGRLEPSISNGLAAARLQHEMMTARESAVDASVYLGAFARMIELAQQEMTANQFSDFMSALRADPMIKQLTQASIEASSREAISR